VFSPDSGNEVEMLSPEHKALSDICYVGGLSKVVWNDVFDAVHHSEEQG
jgi:hypothetical protein